MLFFEKIQYFKYTLGIKKKKKSDSIQRERQAAVNNKFKRKYFEKINSKHSKEIKKEKNKQSILFS